MEELIDVFRDFNSNLERIADKLDDISDKLDDIKGHGSFNSLSDVYTAIEDIKGSTGYDLTDIHQVLSSIDLNTH